MNKLTKLQETLVKRTFEVFKEMEDDIDFLEVAFEGHYSNMGSLIYNIRNYANISGLIRDLYEGKFEELGIFSEEDVDDLLIESILIESRIFI